MEENDHDISVGACIPFEGLLNGNEQVEVVTLPAVETMASAIHHGPFSTLNQAYNDMMKWVEANGYRISGPNRQLRQENPVYRA